MHLFVYMCKLFHFFSVIVLQGYNFLDVWLIIYLRATNSYFLPYGQNNSCFGEQENVGLLVSYCMSFPFSCNLGSALFPFSVTLSFLSTFSHR